MKLSSMSRIAMSPKLVRTENLYPLNLMYVSYQIILDIWKLDIKAVRKVKSPYLTAIAR